MRATAKRYGLFLLLAGMLGAFGCGDTNSGGPKVQGGKGELKPLPAPGAPGGGTKGMKQPTGGPSAQ
jgi:hypothetical protein